MDKILRIGTRDSQLAVWQATLVKDELAKHGIEAELVLIKSDGDIDLVTPLYAMGVQGVFTKTLDAALLSKRIDIAVHSMKDVPTQLAQGIQQAAVLQRANDKDLFIVNGQWSMVNEILNSPFTTHHPALTIATSSIRRKAQWLNRYPNHSIENLRGNVNTRLRKVAESNWDGAIFAAAGLERIGLRPENSIELDWMLPAPAQGAIMIVCRENDKDVQEKCFVLNDEATALCVKAERDFLKKLLGGCSTPISALAKIKNDQLHFTGNIFSLDGKEKVEVTKSFSVNEENAGTLAAKEVLLNGGDKIAEAIRNAGK
jgi:hydroxymethylbilane synthase